MFQQIGTLKFYVVGKQGRPKALRIMFFEEISGPGQYRVFDEVTVFRGGIRNR